MYFQSLHFIFIFASADLIGYNRLSNTVNKHHRYLPRGILPQSLAMMTQQNTPKFLDLAIFGAFTENIQNLNGNEQSKVMKLLGNITPKRNGENRRLLAFKRNFVNKFN